MKTLYHEIQGGKAGSKKRETCPQDLVYFSWREDQTKVQFHHRDYFSTEETYNLGTQNRSFHHLHVILLFIIIITKRNKNNLLFPNIEQNDLHIFVLSLG